MNTDSKIVADVLRKSLIGIICCVLLALAIYGWNLVFLRTSIMQIIAEGVIGSLFFYTLRINRRNAFALLFVLFVLDIGFTRRHPGFLHILGSMFFVLFIAAAIYIFFTVFYLKTVRLRYLHPLVLATLFAALSIVMLFLNFLVDRVISAIPHPISFGIAEFFVRDSFVVGLGIGISVFILDSGYDHSLGILVARFFSTVRGAFRDFGDRL